jgi:cation:H+ antiporter
MIAITGVFVLFGFDKFLNGAEENILSRSESIIFIILLALYLSILIFNANRTRKRKLKQEKYLQSKNVEIKPAEDEIKDMSVWKIVLYLILGLSAVVFGGECVATTAEYLAIKMGMSEALVGLTIVAFGTSLPELVTSIIAAKKGENDLALGNVVGSNIINISLILGTVGLISQAPVSTEILTDMVILLVSTVVFVICCVQRAKISKWEGILFISMYLAYLSFAIVRNYCF